MAGAKNHDYHILQPDHLAADRRVFRAGDGGGRHLVDARRACRHQWRRLLFFAGVAGVLFTMFSWWSNVIKEAHAGDHTPVVQLHLRYGMILFIASEVMFFVGWFWAFFDFSLFPAPVVWDAASKSASLVTDAGAKAARCGRPRASRSSTPSSSRCSTR